MIKLWENDLTITENYIKKSKTYHIEKDETIIGFYSFFEQEPKVVCLDNVFIKPDYIGKGFGRILMEDFFKKIRKCSVTFAKNRLIYRLERLDEAILHKCSFFLPIKIRTKYA